MEYPGLNIAEQPITPLPQAVFEYFERFEPVYETGNRGRTISVKLGQACAMAARDKAQAGYYAGEASLLLEQQAAPIAPNPLRRKLQFIYADLVRFQDDPEALRASRQNHYAQTMEFLVEATKEVRDAEGKELAEWIGLVNELTVLAIFNRYCHPWMIALPALEHHDSAATRNQNYDLVVITSSPFSLGITCKRVEVKSSKLNTEYDESIQVILANEAFGHLSNGRRSLFPVTALLINEFYDIAKSDEIAELDRITDGLLFSLSD